jgi:hypothetical protein
VCCEVLYSEELTNRAVGGVTSVLQTTFGPGLIFRLRPFFPYSRTSHKGHSQKFVTPRKGKIGHRASSMFLRRSLRCWYSLSSTERSRDDLASLKDEADAVGVEQDGRVGERIPVEDE